MSDVVIRVENLGKRFRIGGRQTQYRTIREAIVDLLTAPASMLRRRRNGTDHNAAAGWIWALQGISLEVRRGEVLGIIGRNGAGKTTLLKILSRVTKPTVGFGEIHGRLGSLLEVGTGFHPELTGRENIYLNGAILGMKRSEISRKFDEIVAFAEVEKFIDTPVKHYSSGMYLRLAFSVAAHLEPDILIVDEVLAVGDAAFQSKCMGKMSEVSEAGRTVLFVSHSMAAITALCSEAILLEQGKIVQTGPVHQVVDSYLATVHTNASVILEDREDRTGSGRLRLTKLAFKNSDTEQYVDAGISGKDLTIEITYASGGGQMLPNVSLAIGVYGNQGQFLTFWGNEMVGRRFESLPPCGQILCHIPHLPLAAGQYILNLHCNVNGVTADWIQQGSLLVVSEGDFYGTGRLPPASHGGVLVPQIWSSEPVG